MPDLSPFRATCFSRAAGDPSELLAPPYDVIDPEEAGRLRDRSPHNAVRLVLPEGDAPDRYELAARRLRSWIERGVLERDASPAMYVYAQDFRHADRPLTRIGVFGALRLAPLDAGSVLPHEHTHGGPKADRLALNRACDAQLSPVFLVATDPDGALPDLARRATAGTPSLTGETPDGIRHRLWRVPADRDLARELRRAVAAGALLIADGHHRYETALELARGRSDSDPRGRVLACVVSRRDPGLLCLPTHRTLSRPPGSSSGDDPWLDLLDAGFEVEALSADTDAPAAARAAEEAGTLVLFRPGEGAWRLRPSGAGPHPPAPVLFDRRVLREGCDLDSDAAVERGLLSHHRDAEGAVRAAGERGGVFFLPPPDVEDVFDRAKAGERLPPKSTYFWPKLPSGLLFREFAT